MMQWIASPRAIEVVPAFFGPPVKVSWTAALPRDTEIRDRFGSALARPGVAPARARRQNPPLSVARRVDSRAKPCPGHRHRLHPDGAWRRASGGGDRPVRSGRAVAAWRWRPGGFQIRRAGALALRRDARFSRKRWTKPCPNMASPAFSIRPKRLMRSEAFTGRPAAAGIAISMDGRGRFMDTIFIARLRRMIECGEGHPKAHADGRAARAGIGSWMEFHNARRPRQAMANRMPMTPWQRKSRSG